MDIIKVKSSKDVVWDALCKSADDKGKCRITVMELAQAVTKRSSESASGAVGAHATVHLLYSLQKAGLITFREVQYGTSAKDIADIRLTPRGQTERRRWSLSIKKKDHDYRGHKKGKP